MFTIVIPLYNKEKYVSKTIESIKSQAYENFECLIIDDGSEDNSVEVCESLIDSRFRIIKQSNKGVSAARNLGIQNAVGDYICFLDADDWWDPHFLEVIHDLIDRNPDFRMFGTLYGQVCDNKTSPYKFPFEPEPVLKMNVLDFICKYKTISLPLHTSSVAYHRSVFEKCGMFNHRISFFEDYDIFFRASCLYDIVYDSSKVLSFYNKDLPLGDSLTSKPADITIHYANHIDDTLFDSQKSMQLKRAIDIFKVKSMILYKTSCKNKARLKSIIKNVDWSNFPLRYRVYYKSPVLLAKVIFSGFFSRNSAERK